MVRPPARLSDRSEPPPVIAMDRALDPWPGILTALAEIAAAKLTIRPLNHARAPHGQYAPKSGRQADIAIPQEDRRQGQGKISS